MDYSIAFAAVVPSVDVEPDGSVKLHLKTVRYLFAGGSRDREFLSMETRNIDKLYCFRAQLPEKNIAAGLKNCKIVF